MTELDVEGRRLMSAGDVDLVAFDYYSRYQRSTGPPCLRFAAGADFPRCKDNKLVPLIHAMEKLDLGSPVAAFRKADMGCFVFLSVCPIRALPLLLLPMQTAVT